MNPLFVEVLAPGLEGVFLVLVPLGKVAVPSISLRPSVGAGWGEAVPARGVVDADGDRGNCFRSCLPDYVAEEGVG